MSQTIFDLKTLNLGAGTHRITAVAKASGYKDSEPSDPVSYVVGGELPDTPDTPETYTLSGTWVFNDEPEIPSSSIEQIISFTSNSVLYDRIYALVSFGGSISYGSLLDNAYDPTNSWSDTAYKTVDFGSTPQVVSEEFYNWFIANAQLQGEQPEEPDTPDTPDTPEATKGLSYTLSADGTYTCTGISDETATDIVIASKINGIPVTKIGGFAFDGSTSITSVVIPDSVTSIEGYAFSFCSSLTSVTIGDGVTTIGSFAFASCDKLASVAIGSGVTEIKNNAFIYCTAIQDVYYNGTEAQWNGIDIGSDGNTPLTSATIHFAEVPDEPEQIQTLKVINSNNENEYAEFDMPYGYTFGEFIGSDYDESGGKFTGDNNAPEIEEAYVYYDGYLLSGAFLPYRAEGIFYYYGAAANITSLSNTNWQVNSGWSARKGLVKALMMDAVFTTDTTRPRIDQITIGYKFVDKSSVPTTNCIYYVPYGGGAGSRNVNITPSTSFHLSIAEAPSNGDAEHQLIGWLSTYGELQTIQYDKTQTLTIKNTNNENDTVTFTMPLGYTFKDFVENNMGDGALKIQGNQAYYYDRSLTYEGAGSVLSSVIATGTFYYAGQAAPELTKLTIYYVKDGKVGNVRAEYDVPVGMKFEELVVTEYNTNGDFSLINRDDYKEVLYKGENLCVVTGNNPLVDVVMGNIIANDGEFYFCCGEEPTQTLRVENFYNAEEFTEYTMPQGTLWSEFVTTQTDSGNTSFTIVDGYVKYNGLTLWSDVSGGVSVTANSVASGTVYYLSGDIQFTIDGTSYQAEQGMSWADWVESIYNINQKYGFGDNWNDLVSSDVAGYYVYNPNTDAYAGRETSGLAFTIETYIIPDMEYVTVYQKYGGGSND